MSEPLPLHEVATLFPRMTDEDYNGLVADIRLNGLLEPILTDDGKVVDGRHRQLACFDAGIDPRYEECETGDLVGFVVSKNLKRRHLDESQRIAMAGKLMAPTSKGGRPRKNPRISVGLTAPEAAKLMNISEDSARVGRKLVENGSTELVEAVMERTVSANDAAKVAVKDKKQVRKALKTVKASPRKTTLTRVIQKEEAEKPPGYAFKLDPASMSWESVLTHMGFLAKAFSEHSGETLEKWVMDNDELNYFKRFASAWGKIESHMNLLKEAADEVS